MKRPLVLALVAASALATPAFASDPVREPSTHAAAPDAVERLVPVQVGDPAPALSLSSWIKGESFAAFEPGTVYVVDFWATWCGPCKAAFPHMTEIQRRYADQRVVMLAVGGDGFRDTIDKARAMVEEKGDQMGFSVAWDQGTTMREAWFVAAARPGIPSTFIVDRAGRIAYIGHPGEMDDTLAQVVAGTHDLPALARQYVESERASIQFGLLRRLYKEGKIEESLVKAAALVDGPAKDDAQLLDSIAWMISGSDSPDVKRDTALALRAAQRANELTGGTDAGVLDTLAWAHYRAGDSASAVATQKLAVEFAPTDRAKEKFRKALEIFEGKKAP